MNSGDHKGRSPLFHVPDKETRELRNIVRHRITLRREITRTKNRIHALLDKHGIKHEFKDLFGKKGMNFINSMQIEGTDQYTLSSLLRQLKLLFEEKKSISKVIENIVCNDKQTVLLTSLKGISYWTALLVTTSIGDVKRFASPKKLRSYAGVVPRTMQSGSHVFHGRLIKECNQNLKWALVQSARIHVRTANSSITALHRRVAAKGKENKAIVAAADKMPTSIWWMLQKGEPYMYPHKYYRVKEEFS